MKIQYLMVPVLLLLQACHHGADDVAIQNYGTLEFAGRYENQTPIDTCSLSIPQPGYMSHTYNLQRLGCEINSGHFSLNNVSSAVQIWFYDHRDCADVPKDRPWVPDFANHWTVQVETIKNPTTTRWVNVTELRDTPIRGIVVAGIQLIDREVITFVPPVWNRQLSCVKIVNLP
ncbi:hypothetical protein IRZ53_21045 [Pseudomonas fulva]|uniref:hypothetical protein n=1 Tax=Pseudomonas fulva TaxID=47880 RepID=UPI0018AB6753|nr:hypothetical protein [Pseudomonas fulva]MBF8676883.1 hypothetical protein [Pseudomonas fulva]MBF8699274.1 hypothetical protein [Pseudomonas fulva]